MRFTELLPGSALAARPRRENILHTHTRFALITCTFALLTWALPTFGHDTPSIRSGVEKHVSPAEVQQIVNEPRSSLSDYTNDHWHQYVSGPYEGQIGGTPNCVADSYDPETDEYGRWDEETYSWDLSGCAGQSSSSSQSDGGTSSISAEESSSSSQSDGGTSSISAEESSSSSQSDDGFATDEQGAGGTAQQPESDGAPEIGNAAVEGLKSGTFTASATEQTSDSQENPESDPLASLSTTIDDVTSAAEHGQMTFTVRLEPTPTAPTAVKYATASRTARAGVDYEVASGTLDFEAGQSTATFTVLIHHDEQDEPDETFKVRIVHPSTGALLAEATGTITDDDGATPPEANSDGDDERAFAFAGVVEAQAYTAGTAITTLVLPEATGGAGEITYSVSGLPAGLSFDAATRTISGTPTAATDGAVEVAYLAEDSTGATTALIFSITVNPPLSFGDLFGLLNDGASDAEAANS